ncbi:hypothetical protein EJD97_008478, partial [Solanum chilense]
KLSLFARALSTTADSIKTPSAATARGPPAAVKWPPDKNQEERSHVGFSTQQNTLDDQPQKASKLQVEDAMESAIYEEAFAEEHENISTGISEWNQVEQNREMNSIHNDLLPVQKSAISTVAIVQNHEANLREVATESPETRLRLRTTSGQIRTTLNTGVCSPMEEEHPEPNSKQIDGEVAGGDNSGEAATSTVGIYGVASEKQSSKDQKTPVTTLSHHDKGQIHNNNNIHTHITHKGQEQLQNLENAGEYSSSSRDETRNNQTHASSVMEGIVAENNKKQEEKLIDRQGNTMEDMSTQATSSNDTKSKFSFAIADNSIHLTPKLFADATSGKHTKDQIEQEQTKGATNHPSKQNHQIEEECTKIEGA